MEKIKVKEEFFHGRDEREGIGRLVRTITWAEEGEHISQQETLRYGVNGKEEKGDWKVLMINSREMVKACPTHARICEEELAKFWEEREREEQD